MDIFMRRNGCRETATTPPVFAFIYAADIVDDVLRGAQVHTIPGVGFAFFFPLGFR